jgi:biotin carboxyl carrier protein
MKYISTVHESEYLIEILDEKHLSINGEVHNIDFEEVDGQPVFSLILDGKSYEAFVYFEEGEWKVMLHGTLYPVLVEDEREKRLRQAFGGGVTQTSEYHLKAPMPGMVVSIPVEEGQQINKGDALLILESMKMQNELRSPRSGKVARIRVKPGDNAEKKQTLLSVE